MANCINELKSWPLRGGVIVISIVSWLLALGFIAYFFGLYLGDVKYYGDRYYYMTVYANKSDAIAPWNNLLKRLKTFSDKLCRGFVPHPTEATQATQATQHNATSPAGRRRVIVYAPYWAWSSPRSLELFTEMSRPDARSGARTRKRRPSRTASRLPADASTMIMPRLPRYGFVWSTKGPTPPSFLLTDLPALPFYPGLAPIFLNRTRNWETMATYIQEVDQNDRFGISAAFEAEIQTTKSLRRRCLTIGANFLEELLDVVKQMQKEFIDMIQGRLHLVFLVLDLVMVLLNSMLCVSSFMLLIGGHTKNRLLVLPWICISGVCVYGNVIYGLLHIVVEHEGEFLMGVVTALHIIFVIVIIILHAVALAFVHRYMLNLFHRDRKRGRTHIS